MLKTRISLVALAMIAATQAQAKLARFSAAKP